MTELAWMLFGALGTGLVMTLTALLIALTRRDPAPVIYDLELRIAAAEVREKLEEIMLRSINTSNWTVIVKCADIQWMRERLFEAAVGK